MNKILLTDEEFLMRLNMLTERQQQIIKMRFGLFGDNRKWSVNEIADYFKTTTKRIEHIEQISLKILESPTRKMK